VRRVEEHYNFNLNLKRYLNKFLFGTNFFSDRRWRDSLDHKLKLKEYSLSSCPFIVFHCTYCLIIIYHLSTEVMQCLTKWPWRNLLNIFACLLLLVMIFRGMPNQVSMFLHELLDIDEFFFNPLSKVVYYYQ